MRPSIKTCAKHLTQIAMLALIIVALPTTHPAHAGGPFAKMHGTWSGGGTVRTESGKTEKIRCRAYYTSKSSGTRVGMAVRCASAGNKFELRASLKNAGGSVSGNWEERTFNAAGSLSGRATSKALKLRISGAMQGNLTISTSGRKQWISISTKGAGLSKVTISLRKRG